jgi:hypothetical protein
MRGEGGNKMATQAISPTPQMAKQQIQDQKCRIWGKDANARVTVCSKLADGPYVAVTWSWADLGKTAISLPIPQQRVFARNLFN